MGKKKMYYNEQEAAEALGISADELAKYIRDDKVRVFQDGAKKMFRADEIVALAGKGDSAEEEEIQEEIQLGVVGTADREEKVELAPVEPAGGKEVELAPVEQGTEEELAFEKTVPLDRPGQVEMPAGEEVEPAPVEPADGEEVEPAPVEPAGGEEVELAPVEQGTEEEIAFEKTVPLDRPGQVEMPAVEEVEPAPVEAADDEEAMATVADDQAAQPPTEQVDIVADQVDLIARQAEPATEHIDAIARNELPATDAGPQMAEPVAVEQGAEIETAPAAEAEIAFEKTVALDKPEQGLTLADADVVVGKPKGKEDTVITAEGISIFDEEDLEIEAADPMAKTQIATSLEDQIESVGSGSGLLDLTRESDDTSLGAEVLDHIDDPTDAAELEPVSAPESDSYEPQPVAATEAAPTFVEQVDPVAGMFGGMIIGSAIVALLLGSVPLASARGAVPGYLVWYKANVLTVLISAGVLVVIAALTGLLLGKAIAARQQTTKKTKD